MDAIPPYLTGIVAVLLLSAFVKILTTLSILRYGIGLHGAGFGLVIVGVSFALSLLVMNPQLERVGGIDALLSIGQVSAGEGGNYLHLEEQFRPFLEKHTDPEIEQRFVALAKKMGSKKTISAIPKEPEVPEDVETMGEGVPGDGGIPPLAVGEGTSANTDVVPFPVLIAAFLISELSEAFQLGFMILIPFFVVDLLVTNILLALGVTQISQAVVALPCKLLLFFAVDGWTLVSEKLISGYI